MRECGWALVALLLALQLVSATNPDADTGVEGKSISAEAKGSDNKTLPRTSNLDPKEKAAALAEARAKYQIMEAERLKREAAERQAYEEATRQQKVTYGGIITLRHEDTHSLLAAANFKYYHQHGSGQHQVYGAKTQDGYTHWRVMPRAGQRWELFKDVPVKGGDTIRLLNMRTKRCLHSHAGPISPITGENEVTNFNEEQGSLDANDNWHVKLAHDSAEWHMATPIVLIHPSSTSELVSRPAAPTNPRYNYTMGHQEVSARKGGTNVGEAATGNEDNKWTAWPVEGAPGFDRYLAVYESPQERENKFSPGGADPDNGPKEISIYCPQNPVVSIADLDYNLVSQGKCFALNLQSPTFESSLTLNCDGKG